MGVARDIPEELIERLLAHAVFDGWSWAALEAAGKDTRLGREEVKALAPKGPRDIVVAFNDLADRRMIREFERQDAGSLPVRERIAAAVRIRLEQNEPHKEALRKLLSFLALPGHAGLSAKCTYRTVDAIWRAAKDTSTDFNFYTKRGLLAGVYGSTVLYWLSDTSDSHQETWAFLDRRVANVLKIPKVNAIIGKRVSRLPSPFRLLNSMIARP